MGNVKLCKWHTRIAQQKLGGTFTLPSNKWISDFYKRHSDKIWERPLVAKDPQRTAALKVDDLAADLKAVGEQLAKPEIAITSACRDDQFYDYLPHEGDKKLGRLEGYCSKARLIQVDEKGQVR